MAPTNLLLIITLHLLMVISMFKTCKSTRAINTSANTTKPFSAILVFGDSTVDTGNNNHLETLFKSNFPPYGQDFPGQVATGRFSNGKLVPDFLASFLGIKENVPPFLDPKLSDDELLTGVCFASAGSGLDDRTAGEINVIPIAKQIEMFRYYIGRVQGIVGGDDEKVKKIINGALVIFSAATNDFAFNFYDIPTRRLRFSINEYQEFIQGRLKSFVKELYDLGCRKMAIAGLPPLGCLPIQMTEKFENPFKRECLEDQNSDSRAYNLKLEQLLNQLEALLPGSTIVYVDIYQPLIDIIHNPKKYGFVETKRGCCGTGLFEGTFLCNPWTPTCRLASQFLFWDSIHPSQSAYQKIANYLIIQVLPKLLHD